MLKGLLPTGPVVWLTGEYIRVSHTFIQREVAALRNLGFDVRTFSVRRTGSRELVGPELEAEAARTFYILDAAKRPAVAVKAHATALVGRPTTWLRMLYTAWATAPAGLRGRTYGLIYFHEAVVLAAELRRQGVVHLHNHYATASCAVARLAAPLAGITWSFTVHGPDDLAAPIHWRLDDKVREASFVVCISSYARSQVMLHVPPDQWNKLHIVHCGVEPARYGRERTSKPDHLLFVGRLVAQKGLPILLEALARARAERPSISLTIVGDGRDRPELEKQAESLGLHEAVRFVGYKNQDEVAQLLSESTALVLPSFAEGVPVVLMEAMATGLPVVATRINGVPELVEDGVAGRLVPPSDEQALANAMIEITEDADRIKLMGQAGRSKVLAEFDLGQEAARLGTLVAWARAGGERPSRRPDALSS
ncbi:glycosyltransferase family 4 protein [Rubellimicrobium rubrum]|uniref:Glycosyltransferase family 4 protein n=1 Tax=Rubellimicrobium rubrum TaxID=2585369 RepID=A0A5C4N274_9RHOB|nr:glycosyltransferase family 4 protein [Rubellimicrobium rubrum]